MILHIRKLAIFLGLIIFVATTLLYSENTFLIPEAQAEFAFTKITDHAPWGPRIGMGVVSFNDKLWVIGGGTPVESGTGGGSTGCGGSMEGGCIPGNFDINGTDANDDIWSSPDGINWSQVTGSAPWGDLANMATVSFNNKLWVMGGYGDPGSVYPTGNTLLNMRKVWSSSDGINWSQVTGSAPWVSNYNSISAVAFNNKIYLRTVSASEGYTPGKSQIWSSPNGSDWTLVLAEDVNFFSVGTAINLYSFNNKVWFTKISNVVYNADSTTQVTYEIHSSSNGSSFSLESSQPTIITWNPYSSSPPMYPPSKLLTYTGKLIGDFTAPLISSTNGTNFIKENTPTLPDSYQKYEYASLNNCLYSFATKVETNNPTGGMNDVYVTGESCVPEPSFNILCTPASATINAGGSTSFNISTTAQNGFNSPVTVSHTFSPSSGTLPSVSYVGNGQIPPAVTTATVSTTQATTPANYTLTFTASGGTVTKQCNVQLIVNPAPTGSYNLTVTPDNTQVLKGNNAVFTVTAVCTGTAAGPITNLAASSPFTNLTYQFSSSSVNCGSSVTLTVGNTASIGQSQYSTPQERLEQTIQVTGEGTL